MFLLMLIGRTSIGALFNFLEMVVKSQSVKSDQKTAGFKQVQENESLMFILKSFYQNYDSSTPRRLKLLDVYLLYIMLTGIFQFVYCCLVGTFPFNAFLSGFISCIASFVLGVSLRMHTNPKNKNIFIPFCPESAFGSFIFAHVILHLVVFNFIG